MKLIFKQFTFALSIVAASVVATSCGNSSSTAEKAEVKEQQQVAAAAGIAYKADLTASSVGFIGYGVGKEHPGKFSLSEGSVTVTNGEVTGGKFVIDINSLAMAEKGEFISGKLRPHLLSTDFFEVKAYKTATFEITKLEAYTSVSNDTNAVEGANYTISGNLTLKSVTKNVSFPAKITSTGTDLTAQALFTIDRSQWNMTYGSDKSLKDKFIQPLVTISLDIKAVK